MEAEGERSNASDVGGTGQSVSIRTTLRNNTIRPTTGEMLPASSVSEQAAISAHGNTDGAITLDAWFAKSTLTSHVENGAVNGDAASTINNQVHAARIIDGSEVGHGSKNSAMSARGSARGVAVFLPKKF